MALVTLGGGEGTAKVTFSDMREGGQYCVFGYDVICGRPLTKGYFSPNIQGVADSDTLLLSDIQRNLVHT